LHRGRRKALRAILQSFRENYCNDTSLPLAIVSSDAEKDADWLEAQVRKEKGLAGVTIIRSSISPILGTHVGPGMVGFTFWGGDRREREAHHTRAKCVPSNVRKQARPQGSPFVA